MLTFPVKKKYVELSFPGCEPPLFGEDSASEILSS